MESRVICRKPCRGVYGVESSCAKPAGHFTACDSIWDHRDWAPDGYEALAALEDGLATARRLNEWLIETLDRTALERDEAIAHDRQPYPTAWAYEQACEALHRAEARVEALSEALDEILLDGAPGKPLTPIQVRVIARAALACPPQQPQKAGE